MKRLTCAPKLPTSDSGAFVTYKGSVLQRPVRATYNLGLCQHDVRDCIIDTVLRNHSDQPFSAPFVAHLRKIGRDKLDIYSEIEFAITEYNVNLLFKTRRDVTEEMTYTLPDLSLEPDARLATTAAAGRRGWFGGLF